MSDRTSNDVLLIDNDPSHAKIFEEAFVAVGDDPSHVEWARTLSAGLDLLTRKRPWVIFLNLVLPDGSGLDSLDTLLSLASTTPVVVIGANAHEAVCKTAMLHGARDYLLEGHLDSFTIVRAIRNLLEHEVSRRELFAEKERAQVTLNSIGDAVLSTDISGIVTYLNVVAEHMTGWSREDAIGRPVSDVFQIIDGISHRPARDPMELAIRKNKAVGLSANCILVRRDGYETAIEDSAAPIHDRDGNITGAVIVFHDVSMAQTMVLECRIWPSMMRSPIYPIDYC
jgi:PAS domain S-box-containing protein